MYFFFSSPYARPLSSEACHTSDRRKCMGTHLGAMSHGKKGDKFYTVTDDESIEDAGLLPGESEPALDDPDAEEIPMRLLNDFKIIDWDSLRRVLTMHPFNSVHGTLYSASGLAWP